MSPLQVTILEIIKANDGKFSWYQLDRALTRRVGVDAGIVSRDLMGVLRELEQAGLISTTQVTILRSPCTRLRQPVNNNSRFTAPEGH